MYSQVTLSNNEHSDKSSMMISSLEITVCLSMEVPAVFFTFTCSFFFLLFLVTLELFTTKSLPQTSVLFNDSNVDVTFAKNLQSKKKLNTLRKFYLFLFPTKNITWAYFSFHKYFYITTGI